ncbi:hypothetical protein RIF29_29008 [Crotalaria pallida]|uniref:Uncharacterized protein n=1 Tax=Crotalaria pallida TaxID=3830 RepID=A0AAN9HX28_CROPI
MFLVNNRNLKGKSDLQTILLFAGFNYLSSNPDKRICSIRYTTPISLPPSAFFSSSPVVASQSFIKGKALVLDYCHWAASSSSTITSRRRRRHGMIIVASSSDVSSSIFDDWKPLKPTSTPSLSNILWPSAGTTATNTTSTSFIFLCSALYIP